MKFVFRAFWMTTLLVFCAQVTSAADAISVSGEAQVRVTPDEAILTIGVETWDKDLNSAKSGNDQKIKKIVNSVTALGVEPKNVQTDYINIHPRYKHEYEKEIFIGYFVRKILVINLKDFKKFDDILTAILENGATHVHGIDFLTTELRKHRDQARDMAVKAATEKASDMAQAAGRSLGKARSISEAAHWSRSYYNSYWDRGQNYGGMTQNVRQNAPVSESGASENLSPGQIGIDAKVNMTFDLE